MPSPIHRLYLRIWLAVVATIVLLTFIFGWIWRMQAEHERSQRPGREIVLLDADGQVLGQAQARPLRLPNQGLEFEVPLRDGRTVHVQLPRPSNRPPLPIWWYLPYDILSLLALIAAAVALGSYPIVRRLTKRLETLQQGVECWGEGDLSRRLPEDGQDEVAFLAQRFNIAASRVEALLISHKALLANASHELRSPLARIRMSLELLREQPSASAYQEIARSIQELDQLIDEILLASRLDASPDDLSPIEIVDLVGLAAEECARTEAELQSPAALSSISVSGSTRLLRRVLRNLLENAKRYGAGHVQLALSQLDTQAEIRVSDRGPGVPAHLRERIFEPFFRLPGTSEREGGVGLGLALVRTIVQRHGGQVRCEDNPGGGACFVLHLPLTKDSGTPQA